MFIISLALSNSFLYTLSLTDRSGCEGHVEDVLEDMTGKILVLLGVVNVLSRCFGGIRSGHERSAGEGDW